MGCLQLRQCRLCNNSSWSAYREFAVCMCMRVIRKHLSKPYTLSSANARTRFLSMGEKGGNITHVSLSLISRYLAQPYIVVFEGFIVI